MTTIHFVEQRSNLLTVKEVSKLSIYELRELWRESERLGALQYRENPRENPHIYVANHDLALLIKTGKTLPAALQATFVAWMNSSFSAAKSLDFFSDCLDHYSSREDQEKNCRILEIFSCNWHYLVGLHNEFYEADAIMSHYHISQHCAIDFIYRGLDKLNETDRVVFKKCIREGTLQDIRDLAKMKTMDCLIVRANIERNFRYTSKYIEADRIALLRYAFESEIILATDEEKFLRIRKELQDGIFVFNLKYFSEEDLRIMWNVLVHNQRLEFISNKTNDSSVSQRTELLKKEVMPIFILLKSMRILHEQSYKGAVMEKCRDYVRHKDDFEYIRKDYEGICNRLASLDKSEAYSLVNKIVQELEKKPEDQKCSFDLTSKKLICKSPEMLAYVKRLLKNETASKILKQFFDEAKRSLITAIYNFLAHIKDHLQLIDADKEIVNALDPISFFES